jgi:hypothetical protein
MTADTIAPFVVLVAVVYAYLAAAAFVADRRK